MPDFEWQYPDVEVEWARDDQILAYYLEGWQYDQSPRDDAFPSGRTSFKKGRLKSKEALTKWISQEGEFQPMKPTGDDWGRCSGHMRLLVFDRTNFYPLEVTIDQSSATSLCSKFQLVPETIPVLLTAEGGMRYRFQRKGQQKARSLQLLIQSNQILKVANFMISLSFDFETQCTTAIACVENEHEDSYEPIEKRLKHVTRDVKNNTGLWAHPTFLPTIFARHYSDEMRESRSILRGDITEISRRLGVSTARSFRPEKLADNWPENLDFRWLITNIHARRVEVMQVREGCKWSCKSLQWLRDLEEKINREGILDEDRSHNMSKVLEYHLSIIEGTEGRYATLQQESEASTNMLFNAINQRDSIIAQRYNEIAKKIASSTKEDSISMSTFTFITALFLPGTFLSTFFSLTMIDWQPQSSNNSSTNGNGTQISKYYWVFWAIDIPLTIFVMLGWYLWFHRAKKTWVKENGIMLDPKDDRSSRESSSRSSSSYSSSRSSNDSKRSRSSSRSREGKRARVKARLRRVAKKEGGGQEKEKQNMDAGERRNLDHVRKGRSEESLRIRDCQVERMSRRSLSIRDENDTNWDEGASTTSHKRKDLLKNSLDLDADVDGTGSTRRRPRSMDSNVDHTTAGSGADEGEDVRDYRQGKTRKDQDTGGTERVLGFPGLMRLRPEMRSLREGEEDLEKGSASKSFRSLLSRGKQEQRRHVSRVDNS